MNTRVLHDELHRRVWIGDYGNVAERIAIDSYREMALYIGRGDPTRVLMRSASTGDAGL